MQNLVEIPAIVALVTTGAVFMQNVLQSCIANIWGSKLIVSTRGVLGDLYYLVMAFCCKGQKLSNNYGIANIWAKS